jgi:hypothetical protein
MGVPVIASDIPVFHEIATSNFTAISPIDGLGWKNAIVAHMTAQPRLDVLSSGHAIASDSFRSVTSFVESL